MDIQSILVHADAGPGSNRRIALAMEIADRFNGSVTGLGAEACDATLVAGDAMLLETLRERSVVELSAAEAHFRNLTAGRANVGWIRDEGYPDRMLALHARGADLIVTSRPLRGDSPIYVPKLSELVMQAGAPVLVAADGAAAFSGRNVVVAWKDTRESRRAVTDALPFLKRAQKVVIVAIGCGETSSCIQSKGLVEVTARLARHGVSACVEIAPKGSGSVTESIEDAAGRHGADLIVAGAFGRPRLEEWWLGGVTEDLVMSSSKFVLLSH
jgi:nucleotide-binding universal stress UspA family protein